MPTSTSPVGDTDPLAAYVPRLVGRWSDADGPSHRAVDGSLVFADVSGFTALSERLARFGRVGAEEITDLLQHVFARLLAVAYADGGSLLKFGGDALLLLFDGDGHPARAAHAAVGMQEELARIGVLRSMAGKVRLGMTVGVHTGRVDLFLVGDSHHELIVTGPTASHVVQLEGAAERGEVVASTETTDRAPGVALGDPRAGGHVLAGTPPRSPMDAPGWSIRSPARYLPTAVRRYLEAGGGGAEHRQAGVGFVAFWGTDALIGTAGPAACAEALDDLVRRVAAACDEHDIALLGSDVAPGGGKLILVAGAPVGHDDDAERLLRASRAVVSAPSTLTLRVGAHAGPLFAGAVGPAYRRTYTVMGDTVNLAARLAAAAPPGEVLATTDTLETTRSRFTVTPVAPFPVKGKSAPIHAAVVGDAHGQRIAQTHHLPLIGRQDEIARLEELLDATRDGGRVVALVGPAGIGKSRLVDELRRRHPERRLHYGSCTSYEAGTPYHAFGGLLRFLLDLGDDASGEDLVRRLSDVRPADVAWAPLVGTVVGIDVPPGPEVAALAPRYRAARLRAVVGALLAELLPPTTMLRIEDVHWIDDASRSLLEHLVRAVLPETSWLVVLTSRSDDLADLVDDVVEVAPLGDGAVAELAHAAAARGLVSLDVATALAARAGGHPLFLEELLAYASEIDDVPDTVERMIAARVDRLDPSSRTLLRHAALLGTTFDLSLLREVLGEPVSEHDLDPLEGFVRRTARGRYAFTHDLYREVAYTGLSFRRRRELHDRAGRVIEDRAGAAADEAAELLALHFHRAGQHERSWHYNRVAARRARARYAPAEAARFLRWALEAGRRAAGAGVDEVVDTWQELGDVMEVLGSYRRAEDAYARARRLAPPARRPALLYRSGIVREREGRIPQALQVYTRALRALEGAADDVEAQRLAARVRLRRVEARLLQGRAGEVVDEARALVTLIEALGSDELSARVHFVLAWALEGTPEAAEHQRRALDLYAAVGDLIGQGNVHLDIGINAYHAGDWAAARRHWERAHELKLTAGNEVGAAIAVSNVGEILSDQGRFEAAEEAFTYALRLHRASGFQLGIGMSLGNLGRLAARRGDLAGAGDLLDEALEVLECARLDAPAREMRARIAERSAFAGDHDAVERHARLVLHTTGDASPATAVAARALAVSRHRAGVAAAEAFVAARARAEAAGSTHELLLADAALAWALADADPSLAEQHRRAALDRAGALDVVVDPVVLAVGPDVAGQPLLVTVNQAWWTWPSSSSSSNR